MRIPTTGIADAALVNQHEQRIRALENISTDGLVVAWVGPTGLMLSLSTKLQQKIRETADEVVAGNRPRFPAIITNHVSIGSNRWGYTFTEAQRDMGGDSGRWVQKVGGRQGGCRNSLEDMNSAAGVQGNGVNVDNLQQGWSIQPCPVGACVSVWEEIVSGERFYFFEYSNGTDGECSL